MSRMVADSYYEYINKHSISKHLKCTICDNPFIDPVKTGCKPKEHVYCNQCITQWLKRISECPSCRSPLQKKDLKTVTENIVLDILNELPVQCKLCGQQGIERGDFYVHHTKLCPVANVPDASADTESLKSESSDESNTDSQTISRKELPSAYIDIKANNKHQQLTKHVNQQKLEIPNPQNENEQSKVRPEPPKSPRPLPSSNSPRPLSSSNSPLPGKFLRPNVDPPKPPVPVSIQSRATKEPCEDCSDCWKGAVRGSYFRGKLGGGFQPGKTLTPCACNCHNA